ncbi:hypothetical protein LTS08_000917 [Lithohypha guttulata]|uniref:uncharacterized protein n=1 Tax=Lithohypha guttulata TaxID=1690604 RepID=UPI002DDFEBCD|nr:hypothetical protein LTS08_000917 [Lithohypha guttulata]
MSALNDVNSQIDPGSDNLWNKNSATSNTTDAKLNSSAQNVQEQAAGLADAVKTNAANAYNSVQNSQFAQDIANGPAAQTVKEQAAVTGNEFSDLANSRKMPNYKAANDTPLTRATGITFASLIIFIFSTRYLPLARLFLKGTWTILGIVTLIEAAAQFTIGSSVANSVRPRKYYKIPKENLEATLDDVEQLINFFVIEGQRIIFAENIPNTAIAFLASFLSYYLIKLLPAWGFALFSSCIVFLVPLVYTSNKELIDSQLQHANEVVTAQTQQLRDITADRTSKAAESVKSYTNEYAGLASEYIGKSRQKISMPATNGASSNSASSTSNTSFATKEADFPKAPSTDFPSSAEHTRPIVKAPGDGEPVAASAYAI